MTDLYAEYDAKGWPSIDPRSRAYCYQPCETGVHVCGEHPDGDNCMSVLNIPCRSTDEAVRLFEQAKADLSIGDDEESDFVVDLMIAGDCDRDFRMNRQMLDRLKALRSNTEEQP